MTFIFKFMITFYLSLSFAWSASSAVEKSCRSYFIQSEILNLFSENEKSNLETAARKVADLFGKAGSDDLEAKSLLNTSVLNWIQQKKIKKQDSAIFINWFLSRINFYKELQRDSLRKILSEKLNTEHQRAETLRIQKQAIKDKLSAELQILKPLIEKYNAKNVSDAIRSAYDKVRLTEEGKNDILFMIAYYEHLEITEDIFFIVIEFSHISALNYFLDRGVNLNAENASLATPLHIACQRAKNPYVVERLIQADHGARINLKDKTGRTPLNYAAHGHHNIAAVIKILLAAGADPLLKTDQEELPLAGVLKSSHLDLVALKLLIKATGTKHLNTKNTSGETALSYAVHNRHTEAVEILLKAKADPSLQNKLGTTELHRAVNSFRTPLELVQILIEANNGAQLGVPTNDGDLPLHITARSNKSVEILSLLIMADPIDHLNARNNFENTPLHSAVFNTVDILKALLDAGADPTLRNDDNQTAFDLRKRIEPTGRNGDTKETVKEKLALLRHAMEEWKKAHP